MKPAFALLDREEVYATAKEKNKAFRCWLKTRTEGSKRIDEKARTQLKFCNVTSFNSLVSWNLQVRNRGKVCNRWPRGLEPGGGGGGGVYSLIRHPGGNAQRRLHSCGFHHFHHFSKTGQVLNTSFSSTLGWVVFISGFTAEKTKGVSSGKVIFEHIT